MTCFSILPDRFLNRLCLILILLGSTLSNATDVWEARAPVPGARASHSAIWTGTEMIVWGGGIDGHFLDTGGRYHPTSDTWQVTTLSDAPSPRWFHAAVWTGSEMLIWGGRPNFDMNDNRDDGRRYDPLSDTWNPITTDGAPTRRSQCAAVWTGSELIIWGGVTDGGIELNDGAKYHPATDTWTPISDDSGLAPRMEPAAVWTGTEMIIFGGIKFSEEQSYGDGARYNPATDSWTPLATLNSPGSRTGVTAVWTGTRMLVWGGYEMPARIALNTGSSYDPVEEKWTELPLADAPSPRLYHAAVWSGTEMIVWGGQTISGEMLDTGARWNAASNTWSATSQINAPSKRQFWRPDLGVWIGDGMIIAAGSDYPASLDSTFIYRPDNEPATTLCVPPPTGLAAWWRFDEDARDSQGAAHLSLSGEPGFIAGEVRQALQLDGHGDEARAPASATLDVGREDGFSIECWVNPSHVTMQPIVEWTDGPGISGVHFWIGVYGSGSLFANVVDTDGNSHSERSGTDLVYSNALQHVGMSYHKASGLLRFYLEGRKVSEHPMGTFKPQTSYPLAVGYRPDQEHYAGTLDELSIYRRVLTDEEFAAIWTAGSAGKCTSPPVQCTPSPPSLVAWWPGEGNPNDVIGTNRASLLTGVGYEAGEAGQGFAFSGASAGLKIAASPALDLGAGPGFTLEAWINPADLSLRSPLLEWNQGGPDLVAWGVHFYILRPDELDIGPGNLYANLPDLDGHWHLITAPAGTVRAGVWQHVALTYDRATGMARLYCDGRVVSEQLLGSFTPQTTYDFYVGRRPAGEDRSSYEGLLDELSLYNRALSTREIAAIARAGTHGKCRMPPALNQLLAAVSGAPINPAPFLASLEGVRASIERGNLLSAINQLLSFQDSALTEVAPADPVLAEQFIEGAQFIIEGLDATGARREVLAALAGEMLRIQRVSIGPTGALWMEGRARPGVICEVQSSTNLLDWDAAGDTVEVDDGWFEFMDAQPPTLPQLFYRLRAR